MTKKLLAILTLVMIVAVCMAIPAMAADLSWDLNEDTSTVVEAEHIFSGVTEDPSKLFNSNTVGSEVTDLTEQLSNGYLYYNDWISNENIVKTYEFEVISTSARLYDIEFVANGPSSGYSDFSIYANGTLVGGVKQGTANVKTSYAFKDCDMRTYTATAPLSEGINNMSIVVSNGGVRNAGAMDYIKFTPVGEELPLAVIGVEDTTIDPTCLSVVFNKPITSAEGIVVDAQRGSGTKTVDGNKVKITYVVGRTTITVPKGFTGGTAQGTEEAFEETVFAYPIQNFAGKSYAFQYDAATRQVSAYFGSEGGIYSSMSSDTKVVGIIALYDGDKMVAYNFGNYNLPTSAGIKVILPEGEKFTEVKVFGFLKMIDGEMIPVGKASTRTAAQLGAKFE